MLLSHVVENLTLEILAGKENLEKEVTGGYVSDLLSNVMGNAVQGSIWVTMQAHQNVVAVAALAGLSAVLLAGDVLPDKEALQKAEEQGVVLLATKLSSFEIVGKMFALGITGQ